MASAVVLDPISLKHKERIEEESQQGDSQPSKDVSIAPGRLFCDLLVEEFHVFCGLSTKTS